MEARPVDGLGFKPQGIDDDKTVWVRTKLGSLRGDARKPGQMSAAWRRRADTACG